MDQSLYISFTAVGSFLWNFELYQLLSSAVPHTQLLICKLFRCIRAVRICSVVPNLSMNSTNLWFFSLQMKISWIKSSTKWYLKLSKNNISVQFVSCHSYQENLLIDIRWVLTRKKSTLFNITVQDVQITTNQRRIWTTTFKLLMLRNVQNAHNLFNLKENSITIMSKLILCLVLNVQNDFLQKIC